MGRSAGRSAEGATAGGVRIPAQAELGRDTLGFRLGHPPRFPIRFFLRTAPHLQYAHFGTKAKVI
jgi:hypothetical protein